MALVRYFAGAAQASGREEEPIEATTLGQLLTEIRERHGEPLTEVLAKSSLLMDGRYVDEASTPVGATSVVDVLPPFAGG